MANEENKTEETKTERKNKRNLLQKLGDWWSEKSTGEKIFSGISAAGLAAGIGFAAKALFGGRDRDEDDEEDDEDDEDDYSDD